MGAGGLVLGLGLGLWRAACGVVGDWGVEGGTRGLSRWAWAWAWACVWACVV